MDDISLRMMQLGAQGFCCSQILLALALETRGQDNPDLVRAMAGLCNGLGDCSGPCGALTGGTCLLALYAGRGNADEEQDERLPLMISLLTQWFQDEIGARHQGVRCGDILGENGCGAPDPGLCGSIVADTFRRCMAILQENGIDPTESRDPGEGV